MEQQLTRIYNQIKTGDEFGEICQKLDLTETELYGVIELLKLEGKNIDLEWVDEKLLFKKSKTYHKQIKVKDQPESLIHTKLCIVSDTHMCSKKQQLTLLNEIYKEAKKRNIDTVLHCGDVVDGDYHRVRPAHLYEIFRLGFTEQADYVVDMYPEVEGITTYFITGSHDDTHVKNGGAFLGKYIEEKRKDMKYLGPDEADIKINDINIRLKHPGDGATKYLSYKPQNIVDSIETGEKPSILLIGHYHKCYYMLYRNVHTFLVPCCVDQTSFMKNKSISNIVGAYFLDIYSNKKGEILYIAPEEYLFSQEQIKENDYTRCRKLHI